jgi:hypothetical protein
MNMTDHHLIQQLLQDATDIQSRGFPTVAVRIKAMTHRFETLAQCHKLLCEREERLTQEIVALRR